MRHRHHQLGQARVTHRKLPHQHSIRTARSISRSALRISAPARAPSLRRSRRKPGLADEHDQVKLGDSRTIRHRALPAVRPRSAAFARHSQIELERAGEAVRGGRSGSECASRTSWKPIDGRIRVKGNPDKSMSWQQACQKLGVEQNQPKWARTIPSASGRPEYSGRGGCPDGGRFASTSRPVS